jgi:hypothetical protein
MRFAIIHPSRQRPIKSAETFKKWSNAAEYPQGGSWICSLDWDDDVAAYVDAYKTIANTSMSPVIHKNKSSVEAINNAAKHFMADEADVFIVVSDDTEPCEYWDTKIADIVEGKTDWILKTQDDIQPYIITMPVMDRAYFNRTGTIYEPSFEHLFCDTYMTCVADITGRKITSDLLFPHNNPGHYGKPIDDVNRKNDATWKQGEETFIRLMKQFSRDDLKKITDRSMLNWLRNYGKITV